MFNDSSLLNFETFFDVDMMLACCATSKELKKYGKESFNQLHLHFAELFTPTENANA